MTKIGVAITTHGRPQIRARSLQGWATYLDGVDELVVIHDQHGQGVAPSKNRSIAALYDLGCTDMLLADDDVAPVTDGWWEPYVSSPYCSLAHNWGKSRFLYERDGHTYWKWSRGVLLYITRDVVERVGGMRLDFRNAGEHIEYQRRICNAGLVPHPFIDVAEARNGIWWAADYTREVPSSLPDTRWNDAAAEHRHQLYHRYKHSIDYVDYHQ